MIPQSVWSALIALVVTILTMWVGPRITAPDPQPGPTVEMEGSDLPAPMVIPPLGAMAFVAAFQKERKRWPDAGGGGTKTEVATYVPAKVQIERLLAAGMRLQAARAAEYELQPGEPDEGVEPNPTTAPGFDLADVGPLAERSGAVLAKARAGGFGKRAAEPAAKPVEAVAAATEPKAK